MKKIFLWVFLVILCSFTLLNCTGKGLEGAPVANWNEMAKEWEAPQWFQDAKFGLWLHWGPQSKPRIGGGWYARHMYQPNPGRESWGASAYQHHVETYGHPSEYGYKELCRDWKAEYFDADQMVDQFEKWGAKYVAVIANHHDNFDLFYSKGHPWNSKNIGPKKDIVGEITAAARKRNLPVEVSVHCARAPLWFSPSASCDKKGEKKGIPYDGSLDIEDGKGTWWEGMDPHLLYANRLKRSDFKASFRERLMTLVTKYEPDALYFDDGLIPLGAAGMEPCAELYSRSLKKHGQIKSMVTVKMAQKGTMLDLEKGGSPGIRKHPYQMDTTLAADWFYKEDGGEDNLRHNERSLIEVLVDTTSKNGTLLLNIAVLGNGKIPQRQIDVMEPFSAWLKAHGEAIYKSRPWITFGEGGDVTGGHFSERTRESLAWDETVIRYTQSADGAVYAFVFGNPAGKNIVLNSFGLDGEAPHLKAASVSSLNGSKLLNDWSQNDNGLVLEFNEELPWKYCNVVKIIF